jgi:ferrous iron transport protein A
MSPFSQAQLHPSPSDDTALTLDQFEVGVHGLITAVHAELDLKQRLAALGLREGVDLHVLRKASFGGPVHVRVGTTEVIMRCTEAQRIVAVPKVGVDETVARKAST